ncbi:hypothetical protein PQC31_gp77 [Pseudomonas phage Iggy]|uniref:Uncharacterized protein n=1 Tax=Pseudomonas phage Iggy TaxID=2592193 RepID=A0A7S5AZ92_9CAUD|nr:hypothetical protein PQC31_gp77 [Pseudomonas phage Iggy]QEA09798.1 hypothetical protein [Pseudomonas phage Iggy]
MANVKFYSSKSNAKRAATQAGINIETATLLEQDGKFAYVAADHTEATNNMLRAIAQIAEYHCVPELDLESLDHKGVNGKCPHCGIDHLDNGWSDFEGIVDAQGSVEAARAIMSHQYTCLGCGGEWGPLVETKKRTKSASTGTGIKIEKNRSERNGVTRPSTGGQCDKVWSKLDEMSSNGKVPAIKDVKAWAKEVGMADATASTQYARWRKYMGIVGRQTDMPK